MVVERIKECLESPSYVGSPCREYDLSLKDLTLECNWLKAWVWASDIWVQVLFSSMQDTCELGQITCDSKFQIHLSGGDNDVHPSVLLCEQ